MVMHRRRSGWAGLWCAYLPVLTLAKCLRVSLWKAVISPGEQKRTQFACVIILVYTQACTTMSTNEQHLTGISMLPVLLECGLIWVVAMQAAVVCW